jgi:hypothetical protein
MLPHFPGRNLMYLFQYIPLEVNFVYQIIKFIEPSIDFKPASQFLNELLSKCCLIALCNVVPARSSEFGYPHVSVSVVTVNGVPCVRKGEEIYTSTDKAQTALFKDPVRTAL